MSRFVNGDSITVNVGECQCPGAPHEDGDTVQLRPRLTIAGGLAALAAITENTEETRTVAMGRTFLEHGICGWNLQDDHGAAVAVTPATIAQLDWETTGYLLADKAADLYGGSVLGPLVRQVEASSPSGPTEPSTSAKKAGSTKRPRR